MCKGSSALLFFLERERKREGFLCLGLCVMWCDVEGMKY